MGRSRVRVALWKGREVGNTAGKASYLTELYVHLASASASVARCSPAVRQPACLASSLPPSLPAWLSTPAPSSVHHLQASLRQVEARAEELKAASQGHESRAAERAAELARANTALERLGVGARCCGCLQAGP